MVAISIIVSTRADLAANDRPAAHVAAGVPIGVAINKTVGRNDDLTDLTRFFADFATRGKQRESPSVGPTKHRADRSQATTVIDEDTKGARSPRVAERYLQSKVGRTSVTGNRIFSFLEFWVFTGKDERRKTGGRTIRRTL